MSGSRLDILKKQISSAAAGMAITSEWQRRFFVLSDGKMQYWYSEPDYLQGKPGCLEMPIDIARCVAVIGIQPTRRTPRLVVPTPERAS